ncbi:sigma-70 family RNA polymerase sigma factor [Bacillus pseudomycoides]|uniref:sigma-70 family RNA polymerase sigma factor n=1 Tax=Bacillus pseudomycoides TaxID=64104 RepID=UPI000BF54BC0|nr:sigma-70 family RNA polymerase sigma factor [Bacillus pseudomycoides]PGA71745.1 hypothetical protein COL87_11270 [Bacillus pseudomycoides]
MFFWLKDYQELKADIAHLEGNLDKTKAELKRWVSGDLQKVRLTAESEGAKVEDRIEAVEYELAHKINDFSDMVELISTFHGLENKIFKLKYIDGMTLEKVAEELNYSAGFIKNKHAEIMKRIRFAKVLESKN